MTEYKEPSISYQAVKLAQSAVNYRTELSKAVRSIADYKREKLIEMGIADPTGKLNAMKLWSYINDKVGAQLRKKHFGNENEYRLVVPYNVVNSLVRKYKNVDNLMELLANTYGNAGQQFATTKFGETIAAKPTDMSKPALFVVTSTTSDYTANKGVIGGLTDPQEASAVASEYFGNLVSKTQEAVATGTEKDLEGKVAEAEKQFLPKAA